MNAWIKYELSLAYALKIDYKIYQTAEACVVWLYVGFMWSLKKKNKTVIILEHELHLVLCIETVADDGHPLWREWESEGEDIFPKNRRNVRVMIFFYEPFF